MSNGLISGLCAALGAVLGKVAFGDDAVWMSQAIAESLGLERMDWGPIVLWMVRTVFAGMMLLMNTFMISFYVKALSKDGTFVGTVTNTSVNLISSSLLGFFLFKEQLTMRWSMGAALTIFGILCIQTSTGQQEKEKTS